MTLEPETPKIITNEEVDVNKLGVQKILERLKNGKAVGKIGMGNVFMKYCGATMPEQQTAVNTKRN